MSILKLFQNIISVVMFAFMSSLFLGLILFLVLSYFFNFNISRAGHWKPLETIEEAKEMNVFIAEYIPPNEPIELGDGNKLIFTKAWLTNSWVYSYFMRANIDKEYDNVHLIQDSSNRYQISEMYYFLWNNGYSSIKPANEYPPHLELGHAIITGKSQKDKDTLKIYVAKGRKIHVNDDSELSRLGFTGRIVYDTLTSFILVRKK